MEIYAEYLFIENFAACFFILLMTAKICGRHIKKRRLMMGGVWCGLYSFVILLEMNCIVSLACKFAFSFLLICYTFDILQVGKGNQAKKFKTAIKILITFYTASFLTGGVTVAMMYVSGIKGIAGNGTVYIESVTYLKVAVGIFVSCLIGCVFAKYIKERTVAEKMRREAVVEINGKKWKLNAMIDTGNFLKEPVSGKPVAVICESAAREMFKSGKVEAERLLKVPYKAVGSAAGVLTGFTADRITVDGKLAGDMVLAVYEGEFNQGRDGGIYRMLLNQALMEGGIAVNE